MTVLGLPSCLAARLCRSGLALAVGQIDDARRMLSYLISTQLLVAWAQNCFPDGRPFWGGVQLDEMAFPVILAAKLAERGASSR
jgi:glucoamylase